MEDLMLKLNLKSLNDWYKEQYAPETRHNDEEEISKGPTGLWGWFNFLKKKFGK